MFTPLTKTIILFFKSQQGSLFAQRDTVSGYVNPKGTFVAPYQGTRHHTLKKPKHPLSGHLFADHTEPTTHVQPEPVKAPAQGSGHGGDRKGGGGSGNGGNGEPPDRINEEELNRRGQRVRQYVEQVKAGTAEHSGLRIGTIGNDAAQRIAEKTALPANGSLEVVVADTAIHVTREHPDLMGADWERLPRLIEQFDDAAMGRLGKDPKIARIIAKKTFPDGTGYGAVLDFAQGGKRKRLNLVTYFKGKGNSLDAWWNQNKLGLGSSGVPDSTEPASNAPRFLPKPDASLPPPTPEGKTDPAPAKEPWQIPKNEFGYGGENNWPLHISSKGKVYGDAARAVWAAENPNRRGPVGFYLTKEAAQKWVDKTHKRLVKEALRAGHPVPTEVLADYPELQQKTHKSFPTHPRILFFKAA